MCSVGKLRKACGDRAVLRALHFFEENGRVPRQTQNLRKGNLDAFLKGIIESGESSWMLLQNVYPAGPVQPMADSA